jgi:electron transfer flavoprotein alpha subunit
MNGILVIAEAAGSTVRPETLAALALGIRLRSDPDEALTVLLVAPDQGALPALAVQGVDAIVHAAAEPSPDAVAQCAADLSASRGARLILAGHTVTSAGYGARIAIEADAGFAAGVVTADVDGGSIRATRGVYGGRLQAELRFAAERPVVLLVRGGDPGEALPRTVADPPVIAHPAPGAGLIRSRRIRVEPAPVGDVDLPGARFVIGIGRGIGDRERVEVFEDAARRLGATLGSSRPLVDAGWMRRERQVGQSGASIRPAVYLAFGISGAAEHLAGIAGAETIIAVNTDARAPIFAAARFGVVADAIEVVEALVRCWD